MAEREPIVLVMPGRIRAWLWSLRYRWTHRHDSKVITEQWKAEMDVLIKSMRKRLTEEQCLPSKKCGCMCHHLSDGLGYSHAVACCDSSGITDRRARLMQRENL